ncbi:MAG TPA: hypothetical protein PKD85_17460, partial [Saprospiraceae bacterium]|nr:hypothetical protein [Saprospiraceae bacterium]
MPESLIRFGLDDSLKDFALRNSTYDFTIHYRSYNYVKLDQSVEVNLYRIIQEAINNTLKHAKAHDVYL